MYIKVAIVGRPNVGKSTLFNKIAQKNASIVFNTPGVTRDRVETVCEFNGIKLKLVDTAGFDNTKSDLISVEMIKQCIHAIQDAEIILFIVDVRDGVNRLDNEFAKELRKYNKEVILVCNKAENGIPSDGMGEIYSLGFKKHILVSAEHKIGFSELCDGIKDSYLSKYGVSLDNIRALDEEAKDYIDKAKKLSIAFVGRPNAGKSTIFNKLLGEYRSIVSEIAGTTRDSVHEEISYKEHDIDLVDTAGIRKRLNMDDKIEEFSVESAFHAINFSTVVVLCMDCVSPFDSQDLRIAEYAIEEGRGVILVLNKWDLLNESERRNNIKNLEDFTNKIFPKAKGLPFFTISGKSDEDINDILDEALQIHKIWSKRINTFKLNGFLRGLSVSNPAPRFKNHEVKIKYATQIKTRPMTLCIFTNFIDGITDSYQNFIENEIRKEFGIFAVPIRISIRKSDNPFADKVNKMSKARGGNARKSTSRFAKVVKKSQARKKLREAKV